MFWIYNILVFYMRRGFPWLSTDVCLDCSETGNISKTKEGVDEVHYIYIYAFSRRFYTKQLTVDSGFAFFVIMCQGTWELNLQPFVLLTQCSTTDPQEHFPLRTF